MITEAEEIRRYNLSDILELIKNHPQLTMRVMHELWRTERYHEIYFIGMISALCPGLMTFSSNRIDIPAEIDCMCIAALSGTDGLSFNETMAMMTNYMVTTRDLLIRGTRQLPIDTQYVNLEPDHLLALEKTKILAQKAVAGADMVLSDTAQDTSTNQE